MLAVPEAATLFGNGGAMIAAKNFDAQQGLMFQKALMKMQIALEDSFIQIANMVVGQEVVLLIDRGLLDGKAFVDAGSWQALMDDM